MRPKITLTIPANWPAGPYSWPRPFSGLEVIFSQQEPKAQANWSPSRRQDFVAPLTDNQNVTQLHSKNPGCRLLHPLFFLSSQQTNSRTQPLFHCPTEPPPFVTVCTTYMSPLQIKTQPYSSTSLNLIIGNHRPLFHCIPVHHNSCVLLRLMISSPTSQFAPRLTAKVQYCFWFTILQIPLPKYRVFFLSFTAKRTFSQSYTQLTEEWT